MSQEERFDDYASEIEILASEWPRYIISGAGIYPADLVQRALRLREPGIQISGPYVVPGPKS